MTTSATIARSGDVGRGGLNETTCLVENCKSCRFGCQIQLERVTSEYCLTVQENQDHITMGKMKVHVVYIII